MSIITGREFSLLRCSRRVLDRKRFLRRIYEEWYAVIVAELPDVEGPVVEIGSGGGFLRERIDGLVTTDCVPVSWITCAASGQELPFVDESLRALVLVNVLHHLPAPARFFAEAVRTLRPGGGIILVEPWVTLWSRFVYTLFHHEPFDPRLSSWECPARGPLSGANGALPWIMLERDRRIFEREFPELSIDTVTPFMPFRYLLSGGMYPLSLAGGKQFDFWTDVERRMVRVMDSWAMFAYVKISRRE